MIKTERPPSGSIMSPPQFVCLMMIILNERYIILDKQNRFQEQLKNYPNPTTLKLHQKL